MPDYDLIREISSAVKKTWFFRSNGTCCTLVLGSKMGMLRPPSLLSQWKNFLAATEKPQPSSSKTQQRLS